MEVNREFELVTWPPLRPARMRRERGSVVVVLPASSRLSTTSKEEDGRVRVIGLDIHRSFAEAAALLEGRLTARVQQACDAGALACTGECLPESLKGRKYYRPTERGFEKEIKRRLDGWEKIKTERRSS